MRVARKFRSGCPIVRGLRRWAICPTCVVCAHAYWQCGHRGGDHGPLARGEVPAVEVAADGVLQGLLGGSGERGERRGYARLERGCVAVAAVEDGVFVRLAWRLR